ncbi:PspC domain-containing protein [Ignavigranum ruoffiae]|uniref:Phage shock protein PspC (Stress-responsive transcriptional regulator) n=1 Tax=Ignavigranum ruoffiae TaxID=89093 RepID=A0A1H9DGM7_9LACT|nr:PspC domain-containing protein [Ignavigranum ruoffiae]UPQ86268.1 PspC domain-containing protein [Ignavigranum ruoffiae]SEQ12549.1 Phage shock protein PspC (stress-responsive transcriptional regulator) [Ignavigranum ruoffiae]
MKKRLYKSSTNKMIMGVCSGLAEYFNIDPTIVRIIALLLLFSYSFGFWLYIMLGVLLPYDYQVKGGRANHFDSLFKGFNTTNQREERKDVTPKTQEDDWSDF